jgi:hypothetical protein
MFVMIARMNGRGCCPWLSSLRSCDTAGWTRAGEGRTRAKARGQHMGRPFKLTADQQQEALARRENIELLSEVA